MKAIILLVFLLTSCSPYAALYVPPVTVTPSATASIFQLGTLTPTPRPTCTVSTGYDQGTLNLRAGPGVQHAVLRVLHEGDVVTILQGGAWMKVKSFGKIGFLNSKYCKEN